jgi:hypothetical protein
MKKRKKNCWKGKPKENPQGNVDLITAHSSLIEQKTPTAFARFPIIKISKCFKLHSFKE